MLVARPIGVVVDEGRGRFESGIAASGMDVQSGIGRGEALEARGRVGADVAAKGHESIIGGIRRKLREKIRERSLRLLRRAGQGLVDRCDFPVHDRQGVRVAAILATLPDVVVPEIRELGPSQLHGRLSFHPEHEKRLRSRRQGRRSPRDARGRRWQLGRRGAVAVSLWCGLSPAHWALRAG